MKNSFKSLILIALGILLSSGVFSQGVAINNDGSPANASAMFDVQSTTSGMLIPRMTATERGLIENPATGLLVFQTDAPSGFYFYNSTIWTRLSAGLDVNGTQNYVTKFTSSSSLGNSIIYDNGTNVGIGTITPDYRFTVVDSTEGSVEDLGTTGFFYNASVADEDMGLVGICDNVAGKGMGVVGIGARYGVVGTSFLEGSGTRIGVFGNFDNFNAERKYAVVGHASGTGINYGIYGIAYGGSENWAGYFAGDTYIQTNLGLGVISPTAQLHTNGTVRFSNYMNGFLYVDNLGNLGVSTASSLFNAGTGLSWSGSTLNSVWTASGNNIYNNNSGNVGIGTASPGQKLHVNGNIKLDDNMMVEGMSNYRVYRNLASYNNSSGSAAGAFVITTNQPWNSACMFRVKIEGYFYDATSPFELIAGGYIYTDNSFYNVGYINIGAKQLNVRFARNTVTNTVAIIIGSEGDSYPYPKLTVTSFMQGHSNINEAYADGWTIAQYTSLANFDYLRTVPNVTTLPTNSNYYIQNQTASNQSANFRISGSGYIASNVGIGTTSPQAKLHVTTADASGTGNPAGGLMWVGGKNDNPDNQFINFRNPSITDGSIPGMSWWSPDIIFGRYKNETFWSFKETHGGSLGSATKDIIRAYVDDAGGYQNLNRIVMAPDLGNVGIGITSPTNKLHIVTSSTSGVYSLSTSPTTTHKGVYGHKYVDASGTSYYGDNGTQTGVFGYYQNPSYGDSYRFGVHGHFYHTYSTTGWGWRCGGVLGSYSDAGGNRGWGALAYNNSGGSFYGGYFTSYTSGSGYMNNNSFPEGIGSGSYGGMIGSWARGEIMGHISCGELFAEYNVGDSYTSGRHAEIVELENNRVAAYPMSSTDVMVYKTGKGKLTNGNAYIKFDDTFVQMLNSNETPNITVTPIGDCKGIHIVSLKNDGFEVAENQGGTSSVEFTWIAIGKRIDSDKAVLPQELSDKNFDSNMKDVMFNDNNAERQAKNIKWSGSAIQFEQVPSKK